MEFENDEIRVSRVNYGPHEKSVMHEHPRTFAIFLTDGQTRFTMSDGKTQEVPIKATTTQWDAGGKPFELLVVEFKTKHAAAK